ncbi:hypothetical protein SISNIDRAFT_456174 [Sistotremastrum niveocremeum HHB9708]|uniref:Auxin efflux carrier n=1 Tax=Sistotremastrum niveocremeum HHB9708 TaxID=1314777 RepID=A0A164T154_9AGAM|nr:hypothetical protein SISNIDRAFT_456174 [Sistotremastrum niveocremeum HHB9708]
MSSSLAVTLLSSFQSSLSVLLTLSYGLVASKLGILSPASATQVARLCIQIFLPALLFTSLGSQVGASDSNLNTLWPLIAWSFAYPMICLAFTYPMVRYLQFPTWTLPAAAFNSATSLPLLLVDALVATGALDSIIGVGPDQQKGHTRLRNYLLINAMISNALTFTLGPHLLKIGHRHIGRRRSKGGIAIVHDRMSSSIQGGFDDSADPLLSESISSNASVPSLAQPFLNRLPEPLRDTLLFLQSLINPPLVAVILAIIVGEIGFLRTAFFEKEGSFFHSWLTKSLENIGSVFSTVQMFVVGCKLYEGISQTHHSQPDSESEAESSDLPRDKAIGVIPLTWLISLRFGVMPIFSTTVVYILLARQQLAQDPLLWFALIIMATGPPAIRLAALSELSGQGQGAQQAVARLLAIFYAITPLISFPVVAALKVCETFL